MNQPFCVPDASRYSTMGQSYTPILFLLETVLTLRTSYQSEFLLCALALCMRQQACYTQSP